MISPYAKQGYIDHQTLSFDAYLKFIEDVFLTGERLDPLTEAAAGTPVRRFARPCPSLATCATILTFPSHRGRR